MTALERLVWAQSHDDASDRVWPRNRVATLASDLNNQDGEPLDLDHVAGRVDDPSVGLDSEGEVKLRGVLVALGKVRIVGGYVWGPPELAYAARPGEHCPACHDKPPGRTFCLVCSRTKLDPQPSPQKEAPKIENRKRQLLRGGLKGRA